MNTSYRRGVTYYTMDPEQESNLLNTLQGIACEPGGSQPTFRVRWCKPRVLPDRVTYRMKRLVEFPRFVVTR